MTSHIIYDRLIIKNIQDRYGRRPVIILSLLGSAFACLIWANAFTFIIFLTARIIAGLSEGNISICLAALADFKDDKMKSRGMAMIGVAYSIGFTVGPMIGAFMSSYAKVTEGNGSNIIICHRSCTHLIFGNWV